MKKPIVTKKPQRGRPPDPNSERSLKPWAKLNMSRAAYYWRKRYGDLKGCLAP
jgi:hypothetical protein